MPIEKFIIQIYCCIDDYLKTIPKIRTRGPNPLLSDAEVITIEILAEIMGHGSDKGIFDYVNSHWRSWFPKLGSRTSFTRQMSNLWMIKEQVRKHLIKAICPDNDLFLFDGFPVPTCHPKRVRSKNPLRGQAGFGYCAAKDHHYFGFKGHVVTNAHGMILNFTFAAANIDERDVLPELVNSYQGVLIADKGLIRPSLTDELATHRLSLQTPLRSNMHDPRPKSFVNQLMNTRRLVETVIGQLVDRFNVKKIRVKDVWHLTAKLSRKILAHTAAFFIKKSLQFDLIFF